MLTALLGVYAEVRAQFASGVSLVEVYVSVTDAQGQPVTGLHQEDFVVEEDGEPQVLRAFTAGSFPLSLAIGVDRSFSMSRAQLAGTASAVGAMLHGLRSDDQTMLIAVGSEVEVLAPLSTDRRDAIAALARIEPWGTTPLFDATLSAIDAIQTASGRRALVLISDGIDRYSRVTPSDLIAHARAKDVLVYPVAIGRSRPPIFAELAAVTGGRSSAVPDMRALADTLSTIARELRSQYLVGYAPSADARSGWHAIHVVVRQPGLRVRARDGYLLP